LIFTFYIPALFTKYLINPIGEETGWTGFALPQLQKSLSPWLGAMLLGLVWALWHLPAYFVPGGLGAFSLVGFGFFALVCVSTRVIWTWITNKAGGSGLAGVLLHASSNAVSVGLFAVLLPPLAPGQTDDLSGPILLGLMVLSAILILVLTRGRLSHEDHPRSVAE
jgi:membrane protease YdiL (CAAX protease family)